MDSPQAVTQTLQLCRQTRQVPGDIVECGTWRAGMTAAMSEMIRGRTSVLFDSFEGLPSPDAIDGPAALAYTKNVTAAGYFENCRASEEEARKTMARSGEQYRIFRGWFEDTVPKYAAEDPSIAVLRLDGDWYASILVCLEHLFPHVERGGLVVIDDYGHWDGCTRAVHQYLAQANATETIRRTRSKVTYLIKR